MTKTTQRLILAAALAMLSACTTTKPDAPVAQAPDPTAEMLDRVLAPAPGVAQAAPTVSAADAKPRPPVVGQCVGASPGLGQCVSMSYYGDAASLLRALAQRMGDGWVFEVTGPQPRLPIYVQTAAKDVEVRVFLGDVALQLAQRADIVVSGKRIELRYRAVK